MFGDHWYPPSAVLSGEVSALCYPHKKLSCQDCEASGVINWARGEEEGGNIFPVILEEDHQL